MATTKLRIKLASYDTGLLENVVSRILDTATKSGCKIVPMAISGTSAIFEDHLPWLHSGKVTLQYGTPIDPATFTKEEQKKIGAYCHDVIEQMLAEQHK